MVTEVGGQQGPSLDRREPGREAPADVQRFNLLDPRQLEYQPGRQGLQTNRKGEGGFQGVVLGDESSESLAAELG